VILMLMAVKRSGGEEEGVCLGVRFFESKEGCGRVHRLLRKQVKDRHPRVDPDKVEFEVFEPRTKNAGWPVWLGDWRHYS
jgi:hypothetical protein